MISLKLNQICLTAKSLHLIFCHYIMSNLVGELELIGGVETVGCFNGIPLSPKQSPVSLPHSLPVSSTESGKEVGAMSP